MVEAISICHRLSQIGQSTRIVMRCLSNGKDYHTFYQRTLMLLIDILELIYCIRDQFSSTEIKQGVGISRINELDEVLRWFDVTLKSMEVYFQPVGIGARYFRKHLEKTFLPLLEQYKIIFILSTQPEPVSCLGRDVKSNLRMSYDVQPANITPDLQIEQEALSISNSICSNNLGILVDLSKRRLQGSCHWVLENDQYKRWLLGSFKFLYGLGLPGAGKTFVSSFIVDTLQNNFTSPDVAIISIFCGNETEKGPAQTVRILQNVLAQLIHRKRSLSYASTQLHSFEFLKKTRASPEAYRNAIRAEANRFTKVYFIIDGLDLLTDRERVLRQLQKLPEHTQIFITLREAEIQNNAGYLDILASPEDLHKYVASRIHQDFEVARILPEEAIDCYLSDEVARFVVAKSHGQFLLAKLHMILLFRYSDIGLLERALHHLPETLSDAYAEIIHQIAGENSFAYRCIYWVLHAYRPLTATELRVMVRKEPENSEDTATLFERDLFTGSYGLLGVDSITRTVRFIHKTAREYLNETAARIFFPCAQRDIAETCLTTLTADEAIADCYGKHNDASRAMDDGCSAYAASYWGYHAQKVEEDEPAIQVLVMTFLNKLCWKRPPTNEGPTVTSKIPQKLGLEEYPGDWSPLHFLAYFGIFGRVNRLLDQGFDVNMNDNDLQATPLHCAAYQGNERMVEVLLSRGANINATTRQGNTALHLAAQQGHRKLIKLLFSRRANFTIANKQGMTCLQVAVGTANDETIIPLLARNRVDVNVQNTVDGSTALHLAVELRRPRILLSLLERGASIHTTDDKGLTPLHVASQTDNTEAISLLLHSCCCCLEARSSSGLTALHLAAYARHWVAFDMLIVGGADINAWNKEGESLLHEQSRKSFSISVASKLLDQGANVEARTSQGYTPLQCAAMVGNKAMFMLLLTRGAKVDVETPRGESLLHITPPCNEDYLEILITVLSFGLDVNIVSNQGWTPFHQTVYTGTGIPDIEMDKTVEYIQLLLVCGADINASSFFDKGETPLHLATIAPICRPSLVSLLIAHGALVNTPTDEGKTPLHLAAERGREAIFKILLDAGADMALRTPNCASSDDSRGNGGGYTALELALSNPLSNLWFDENGGLLSMPQKRRDSVVTIIDEDSAVGLETETGESALVGMEQPCCA